VLHIYRPQWKSRVAEFVDELSDVIASLNANSTDNLVVCGDVNCPGPTPSSVEVGLAEMLDSLGLTQLVGSPMRDNNLLDVLASTSSTLITNVAVDDAGLISDHRIVTANVTIRSPKPTIAYTWRQLWKSRPVDVRVRDPSERAVYQPSRRDRRLREAAGPCRVSTARRDGATTSRSTSPSEANHQVAVAGGCGR